MIVLSVINGPLPKAGVIAAGALVVIAVLARSPRVRAAGMLALLVLAPALLLADEWNSRHLSVVHRHPLEAAVGAVLALAVLVAAAAVIARRRWLVAPLTVLTLPFRIPITTGNTTSNLLIPLYAVLAAAGLAYIGSAFGIWGRAGGAGASGPPESRPRPSGPREGLAREGLAEEGLAEEGLAEEGLAEEGLADRASPTNDSWRIMGASAVIWMERLLVAYVLLYAIQATYSLDFQLALQQVVFFFVPFSIGYCLLRELEWDPRLIRICLLVAVGLALVFSGIGFIEYATRKIFLNHKLMATNADHTYFVVNSVFYDSNIFGRFLALAMVLLAPTLLYRSRPREQLAVVAALAVMWLAMVLSLSRSSLGALLAGLIILAAVRWRVSRAVVAGVVVVAVGAAAVALSPHTFGVEQGANGLLAGRGSLVTGGLHMFGQRPVWGYGSGSFQKEYLKQNPNSPGQVGASHTLPVTIAAEQGVIGEVVYLGLLAAALITLLQGARGDPVRAAVAAAFVALVVHTLVYDDFLSDPISWTLLGVGASLSRAWRPGSQRETVPAPGSKPVPAPAG